MLYGDLKLTHGSELYTIPLVFSGLKCHISVTQFPKYTRLKSIANQLSFVYNVVKSLYILLPCQFVASCCSYLSCCILNLCQSHLWTKYKSSSHYCSLFHKLKVSKISVVLATHSLFMMAGWIVDNSECSIPCSIHTVFDF